MSAAGSSPANGCSLAHVPEPDVFKDTKVIVMGRFLAGLGSGLLVLSSWVSPVLAEPLPCWSVRHEGSDYTVCEVDLRRQLLKFFWKRPDGQPYRYLSSLPRSLGSQSGRLLFALNAGMYHPDYRPVGLYVENGRELIRANTNTADLAGAFPENLGTVAKGNGFVQYFSNLKTQAAVQ